MNKLLIIDPQVCFCEEGASLYVKGAHEDTKRLSSLLLLYPGLFSEIDISLDMHQIDDIAHKAYWVDDKGNHPKDFTQITFEDFKNGIWKPVNKKDEHITAKYLEFVEKQGKFTHTIWPTHAIAGTRDCNIATELLFGLNKWQSITQKNYHTHIKGMDRNTEHYGIFQAEGPNSEFNHKLCNSIFYQNSEVYIAGQAKSHCVATSLKQILDKYPQYIPQITLITDATSNVEGFETIADSIYSELENHGMKTITITELIEEFKTVKA